MIQNALTSFSVESKFIDSSKQKIETENNSSDKLNPKILDRDEEHSRHSLRSNKYKNSHQSDLDKVNLRNSLKSLDTKKLK